MHFNKNRFHNRHLSIKYQSKISLIQVQPGAGGAATQEQYSVATPSLPLANVTIQYGLMIKILDMFFDCKHDRWLQTIHC